MTESDNKKPIENIQSAAQQAAAAETTPAPVQHRLSVGFEVALLLLVAAFAALSVLVTTTDTQAADLFVTRTLQTDTSPIFAAAMNAISWFGYMPQAGIVAVLIVLLLYGFGLRWEALSALIAAVLEEAMDLVVKDAIRRARPSASLVHVVARLNSYSFPSGHVTFYTGFFGFIFFLAFTLLKRSWKRTLLLVIFGGLILLIGVSRIYLGQHWGTDVLGGYLLGSLTLIASIQLYRWGKGRMFVRQPVAPEKERA